MIDVKPWMLPALVLAITAPIFVAFVAGGPFFGFLAAGLVGAVVAAVAIRLSTEPPRRRRRGRPLNIPTEREPPGRVGKVEPRRRIDTAGGSRDRAARSAGSSGTSRTRTSM